MIFTTMRAGPSRRSYAHIATRARPPQRWAYALWLCLALLLSSCGAGEGAGGLNITGSTSVAPFIEHLAETYQREHPGTTINVQSLGSTAGIRAAIDGVAEIGMSSRDLTPDESAQLEQAVIARDALAVIVHPTNPITNLDQAQVQAIFSGQIRSWDALGGPPTPIVLVVREAGSGTFGAFEELVMEGQPITSAALRQGSNGAIRQIVAEDANAIGYISLGIVDLSVKALDIDGIHPSVANVESGEYTFVRPFLFIWQQGRQRSALASDFLDYVLSPTGQEELGRLGLVKGAAPR
jgi:phosphate transport system substrate-binding protein